MTDYSRDDTLLSPFDGILADSGPDRLAFEPTATETGDPAVTYYTREPDGFGPDDFRWQAITDPAEIADINALLARGIDPPYEVWVDQAAAALDPDRLTPTEEGTAVYAWEQTGPAVGDGHLYEITDPVLISAYEEAHPAQGASEIITPADFYDTAWAADAARATDPALYDARIDALGARGDTWLEVEGTEDGFALGRYDAGPIERDTNGWEPVRVGDGPDDAGNLYPDEATARQAAIAYNGADLAGLEVTLDPAPVTFDRDLTPALDL
jgi:hypothetical protein